MKTLLGFLSAVLLAACHPEPTRYTAPDATAVVTRLAKAGQHGKKAKVRFAAASVDLRKAKASHAKASTSIAEATKWVTLLVPAVDSLLLAVPSELRPEVEAMKAKIDALSAEIAAATSAMTETTVSLGSADAHQDHGLSELEKTNTAIGEVNAKYGPELLAENNVLAEAASQESADKVKALKGESWARGKLGTAWGLCGLGIGLFLMRFFTGTLAVLAPFVPLVCGAAGWLLAKFGSF